MQAAFCFDRYHSESCRFQDSAGRTVLSRGHKKMAGDWATRSSQYLLFEVGCEIQWADFCQNFRLRASYWDLSDCSFLFFVGFGLSIIQSRLNLHNGSVPEKWWTKPFLINQKAWGECDWIHLNVLVTCDLNSHSLFISVGFLLFFYHLKLGTSILNEKSLQPRMLICWKFITENLLVYF